MNFKFLLALVCLFVGVIYAQEYKSGFTYVVENLAEFQTKNGGFQLAKGAEPSLEATSDALFLSSLFGLKDKIDSNAVVSFIETLKTADNGFSNTLGKPSDLESVKNALLSYGHLGLPVSDKGAIQAYIMSLYDTDAKLFSNKAGVKGSIKATATAFDAFNLLGLTNRENIDKVASDILKVLRAHVKSANGEKFFSFPNESVNELSTNYYAIAVGHHVGFTFDNVQEWAKYFLSRQVKRGGFTSNKEESVEATAHSVSALHLLQKSSKVDGLVESIDSNMLVKFVTQIPQNLASAANAYLAVSHTKIFQDIFTKTISYELLNGAIADDIIIQGTQLKPVLTVKTFYGHVHAGLNVDVTISHSSIGEKTVKLQWNQETQQYTAGEFFDTADKLGPITFVFHVKINLVGMDAIEFQLTDSKKIGYQMKIKSTATLAGKDIEPNGVIAIGTSFNFNVALSTQSKAKISSGDFSVVFSVLDSSNVLIHTSSKDAKDNKDAISFSYDLKSSNIPAGALSFLFQVKNADGVHTQQTVTYKLDMPMVATNILFKGTSVNNAPEYNVGGTVTVTMQPGSLPDLRTVRLYSTKDVASKNTGEARAFYMDTYAGETLLKSIRGTPSDNKGELLYTFEIPITPTFDSIGTHRVAFRYVPLKGNHIVLDNYNSKAEELFDEQDMLNYVVKAELIVTDVDKVPKGGDLFYGSEINFNFKVQDTISGKFIFSSGSDDSDVYLNLRHTEGPRPRVFTSDRKAATQIVDKEGNPVGFSINWAISANAIKGKGTLELTAEGASGELVLYTKEKKPWKLNVNIGGDIDFDYHITTLSTPENTHNGFLVEFDLSCQQKKLTGAHLRAVVKCQGSDSSPEELFTLPVARNDVTGEYSIGWAASDSAARSGKYLIQFFREVDVGSEAVETEPLFFISFNFQGGSGNILPFRTETVIVTLLAVSFFTFSFKKLQIETKKST